MPGGSLDLSAAPSARNQAAQEAQTAADEKFDPDAKVCHRTFQFIVDPTAALQGLGKIAVQSVYGTCIGERCALWNEDNGCCSDKVQAIALDSLACAADSKGGI